MQIGKQLGRIKALDQPMGVEVGTVQTLMDWASKKFELDEGCNEKILLHGTSPATLEAIFANGLDPGYTERPAFGFGNYLAEDPTKTDQYCRIASAPKAAEETAIKRLHQTLYGADQAPFPFEVHYMLVCRAVLGCPLYTKGPIWCWSRCVCKHGLPQADFCSWYCTSDTIPLADCRKRV